jgi:iron complex transport system permease protein
VAFFMKNAMPYLQSTTLGEEIDGTTRAYLASLRPKVHLLLLLLLLLFILVIWSIAVGSYDLSLGSIVRVLLGMEEGPQRTVVWSIRMPRIGAAIAAGCALGLSGMATQSLLRNPLASPFTLGISQGAAFGAAFSIVVLGAGGMRVSALRTADVNGFAIQSVYAVTLFAFLGAIMATLIILLLARLRRMSPEAIILAGVALSSLFTSGTILVQYFATDTEIATVVFWTFGDVARSSWQEIGLLAVVTAMAVFYFLLNQWNLNAITTGEDGARALGVEVTRVRLAGMFLAALVAALTTAFHGVIAFLGLLAPHIGRRLVGADHRLLVPYACVIGSVLLLAADTFGRLLVGSGTLPVGVLTSFMGAPLFLYLLLRGLSR